MDLTSHYTTIRTASSDEDEGMTPDQENEIREIYKDRAKRSGNRARRADLEDLLEYVHEMFHIGTSGKGYDPIQLAQDYMTTELGLIE